VLTVSVRLNPAQRENNRSSFSAFGGSRFNAKTDELPQAESTKLMGWIWPAGPLHDMT